MQALARSAAHAYLALSRPRAILLVGSGATGMADEYSDVDLVLYYDEEPAEDALAEARRLLRAEEFAGTRAADGSGYGERYFVAGVQHQVAHVPIRAFEAEISRLVEEHADDEALPKIMSGLFEGVALHGAELVERWRRRAAYTEALQRATIERRWSFFPWWYFQEKLGARDATVWRYDVVVRSAYGVVGVLAALNGVYFSTFEFKRARQFLSRLEVAPPDLADRLELLFAADERESTAELERLVGETHALVVERFPDLNLSIEWGGRPTPPGARESPWA